MPSDDMQLGSEVLRTLIVETKDGEWGAGEADADSVAMHVIRGTDFDDVRHLELGAVPVRHIASRHAARKSLRAGDVLIETAGGSKGRPTGRTVFLREELFHNTELPITCASFARFMRFDDSRVEPEYVYWWLQSLYLSGQIETYQVQHSGIARFQFTKFADEIHVPLPARQVQKFVVQMLGAIERRVTLLRQTNTTLESIAQALFKSWFIDFDPVRAKQAGREPEGMNAATAALFPAEFEESALGLIPKGWHVSEVGQAAECVGGGTPSTKEAAYWEPPVHSWATPKDLSGLGSPVLCATERRLSDAGLKKVSSGILPPGALLMSSRAPIGYLAISKIPLAVNQGFIAMRPGGLLPPVYLYFWCQANMDSIKQKANGSTFMEISKAAFRPIPLVLPPREVVASFTEIVGALFERIAANEQQRTGLTDLRDTLLPRLISGKLRLPESAQQLDEAFA